MFLVFILSNIRELDRVSNIKLFTLKLSITFYILYNGVTMIVIMI